MGKKLNKPYWDMTADELAAATRQFDKPLPLSKTKAPTRAERALFERMRRSPHRSVFVTRKADAVIVSIDPKLLRRCLAYGAKHDMMLSEVVNRSLKGLLAIVD